MKIPAKFLHEFQSTLPRRERRGTRVYVKCDFHISIHAPAKGATRYRAVPRSQAAFQSTLPRRERPVSIAQEQTQSLFQSTLPRRERREHAEADKRRRLISIHAPAKGATPAKHLGCFFLRHFNPRSREGSDNHTGGVLVLGIISIHAPAKGATVLFCSLMISPFGISIHAPAKGATCGVPVRSAGVTFQSTLPRRERHLNGLDHYIKEEYFNPRSREGSDPNKCLS